MANEQGKAHCPIVYLRVSNMWLWRDTSDSPGISLLEKSIMEGENPVLDRNTITYGSCCIESRSLGLERKWVVNSIQG